MSVSSLGPRLLTATDKSGKRRSDKLTTKATAKAKITFKPLGNRIVVEPSEEKAQMSAGGIYIPDTAKEKPQEGKVVAVGPGRMTDEGKRIPMDVVVGDTIVYSKYGGSEYKVGETEYLVLREDDVLMKK
jgi:chaperonin GroES